jgi:phospholipase A1
MTWRDEVRRQARSAIAVLLLLPPVTGAAQDGLGEHARCLLDALARAAPEQTVAELRAACQVPEVLAVAPAPVSARLELEQLAAQNRFAVLPHRPNYVILGGYNFADPNEAPLRDQFPGVDPDLDRFETKFQISLKVPVARELFAGHGDLYFAYTNRSFWQVLNRSTSRPFRETNHEPEAWVSFETDWSLFGWRAALLDLGLSHQSNGRGGSLSRSWNRVYARAVFERDNMAVAFKPWWRIPEPSSDDENPDIEDYMGNFELLGSYRLDRHSFSLLLRNNLDLDDNHGAVQVDWSFPLHGQLRGYLQWFYGYGESLVDYDARVNSIGFGLQLTDWF